MKKWINRIIPIIGVLLILLGIALFFKPQIEDYFLSKENNEKIEQYNKISKNENKNEKTFPEIPKDKTQMAGYLEIPSVDIKEPVYPGPATPEQLDRGVSFAEEEESLKDQNVSIAGHTNEDRSYQFSNLHSAKKGDKVYFKAGNKKEEFEITSINNVNPEDVEVLEEQNKKNNQLTLITCDEYDPKTGVWLKRTIVVADKVA